MTTLLRQVWAAYERQLASKPVPTQMATSGVLWCIGDFLAQRIEHYEHSVYGTSTTSDQPVASDGQVPLLPQTLQQDPVSQKREAGKFDPQLSAAREELSKPLDQHLHIRHSENTDNFSLDRRRIALTAAFGAGFIGPVGHLWYEVIETTCRKLVPGGGAAFLVTKVVLDSAIMGSLYVIAFFAFIATALEGTGWEGFQHKMQVDFVPTYAAELVVWPVVQALNFSQVPVRHQLLVVNLFSLLDAAFISWVGNQSDWYGKIAQRLGLESSSDPN